MNTWLLLVALLTTVLFCVFLNSVVGTLYGTPHTKKERGSTATNLNRYSHSNLGLLHTEWKDCHVILLCLFTVHSD
jgi:hypothetical protein